jgi:hypothetical protein
MFQLTTRIIAAQASTDAGIHSKSFSLFLGALFFSSWNGDFEAYGRRGPAGLDCQQFGTPSG